MTKAELQKLVAPLQPDDKLTVYVGRNRYSWTTWNVELQCSRAVWLTCLTHSGVTATKLIGHSRSREGGERRGAMLLQQLQRLREG